MPTELYIKGELHWAKIFEHNREQEGYKGQAKEHDGQYEITVVLPDAEQRKNLKASGSAKAVKMDPDMYEGRPYVQFTRKHTVRSAKGKEFPQYGGPPRVVDSDGKDWDTNTLIGNGSEGVVKVIVYPTTKSNGTRLEAVMIQELVEYEGVADTETKTIGTDSDEMPF